MSGNSFPQTLVAAQADGTAISNSTVAASLIPAKAQYIFPASFFSVGSALRVTATGRISNVVTTPGTLTLDLRLNSNIVATTDAMGLNVNAKTSASWWLEWILTCRSVGNGLGAKFMHQAKFISESVVGSGVPAAGGNGTFISPAATPAVGAGFDSLTDNTLDFFGKFSVNTAGTGMTCHQFIVETLINNAT